MLRNEKEIMGREVDDTKRRILVEEMEIQQNSMQSPGPLLDIRSLPADNTGGGQSILNNYLEFLFLRGWDGEWWGLIKEPISVENPIKMAPSLEPATPPGWKALTT